VYKRTGPGDANADGTVDFNDLAAMAQSYNTSGPLMRWSQGDFNYDQTVDFNDLALLAQNYNMTGVLAPPMGAVTEFWQAFAADWEAAQAAAGLPEPGGTLALFMGIALLTPQRRPGARPGCSRNKRPAMRRH
jgi:hypothetical protein